MRKNDVSIVIPALNEPYLPKLLQKLNVYDVHVQSEKGLVHAVWKGIKTSKSNIVVIMDADGSHPPEAIPRMISMLNSRTWFIIGSRYCKGGYSGDSIPRKIVSMIYCLITRIILLTRINDPMSGFWVGYRDKFVFEPNGNYKFGLQLLRKYKNHIEEYPIVFKKRIEGKSKVKPIQALKDLFSIFRW